MRLLTRQTSWQGKEPLTIALGMFDGMHRAHAALIRRAVSVAKRRKGSALVHTFLEHPMEVLCPEKAPKRLQPASARVCAIAGLEPAGLLLRRFDRAYADQPAEAFVDALVETYHPTDIVVGFNYTFGRQGAGTPELLSRFEEGRGYRTHVMPAYLLEGEAVSSTRIRQALGAGDVAAASALLGRPFAMYGRILKNGVLEHDPAYACPAAGAYRVRANECDARLVVEKELRLWGVEDRIEPGTWVRVLLTDRA
ncbi:MAG TPA: hypothetical protein PKE04_10705 [Clostridia bacterium]|nr:hypothetical protein [Clostridia bacterium]